MVKSTTLAALTAGTTVIGALAAACTLITGLIPPTVDLTIGALFLTAVFAFTWAVTVYDKDATETNLRRGMAHWQRQFFDLAHGRTKR